MELDSLLAWPLEAVHSELVAKQPVTGRPLGFRLLNAQHRQHRIGEKDEAASRAKQTRRLGDPRIWVAPDRGAVLAKREIERLRCQGGMFGVGLDEGELEAELLLEYLGR